MSQTAPKNFTGTYFRTMDAKGRLLLPPAFLQSLRKEEGIESFWLTALYGRLTAYLPRQWEEITQKLCSIPMPSRNLSNFKTRLIGLAQEMKPDPQGRIRLPQSLIRAANLRHEIVLVGVLDKFEIWDQTLFDAIPDEDVTSELGASGIEIFL